MTFVKDVFVLLCSCGGEVPLTLLLEDTEMAKETNDQMYNFLWNEIDKEMKEIDKTLDEVREAHAKGELISSNQSFVEFLIDRKKDNILSDMTEEEMSERCAGIQENVMYKVPKYIVIRFDARAQYFENNKKLLGDVLVKIWLFNEEAPRYLALRSESKMNVIVFVDGVTSEAFLLFLDGENKNRFIRLKEFYMISIVKNDKIHLGFLTTYSWFSGHTTYSSIQSMNMVSVINLFLSDWYRNIWMKEIEVNNKGEN